MYQEQLQVRAAYSTCKHSTGLPPYSTTQGYCEVEKLILSSEENSGKKKQ
jgi:hypothetical protein